MENWKRPAKKYKGNKKDNMTYMTYKNKEDNMTYERKEGTKKCLEITIGPKSKLCPDLLQNIMERLSLLIFTKQKPFAQIGIPFGKHA